MPANLHPSLLHNQRGNLSGGTIGTFAGMVAGVLLLVAFPELIPAAIPAYVAFASAASIGGAVGGIAGGLVDFLTTADTVNRQQEVANVQVQTSQYGTPMPQVFGSYRLAGNIIFLGPKIAHEVRRKRNKKGKGKGPSNVTVELTYTVDLAIAICETQVTGPMLGISACFADGTLLWESLPPGWTFHAGTDEQSPDPVIAMNRDVGTTPGWPFLCYVSVLQYDMGQFPRVPNFTFIVTQAGPVQLSTVVERLTDAAGIPAEQRNLTAIPDAEVRFLLASVMPVRAAIEQLQVAYRFVLLESGVGIVGKSLALEDPVGTIPETDLDVVDREDQHTIGVEILRQRTRALSTSINLTYPSRFRDYQTLTQTAMFNDSVRTQTARAVSTTVALDDAQAKALAQENLDRGWLERTAFHFSLGRRWASLEPGDRVTVETRTARYPMTLSEVNYGRPGIMELRARGDSAPVMFVPGALPGTGEYTRQAPNYVTETLLYFLNLPALFNEDQEPRIHVGYGYATEEGWPGATLHRSVDGGESYQLVQSAGTRLITGTCVNALPDMPWYLTDTTSYLEIELAYGELHSVTPAQFQAGAIPLLIGDEVVQVRDAELIAPRTYWLRHFWRGRLGTSWATGTHVAGERVTLLDSGVYQLALPLSERFVTRLYKPVTRSLSIDTATEYPYAMPSENLRPWSVATLRVEQSGTDWVLSWRGRARFLGAWVDGSQATPDGDFLAYRIVIYSDGTGATIVRQVDQADNGNFQARQAYVYDSTQQLTDFGGPQSVLYAQVYQVGRNDVSRPAAA